MRRKIYAKGSGKRASFGVALVLGVLALGAAPARGADPQENFHRYCAQCHGFEGNGRGVNAEQLEIAPTDLTNPKKVSSLTDDQIVALGDPARARA
ncbi:MAG: c-type cytochrome, partial [Nitrospinota bacterium]